MLAKTTTPDPANRLGLGITRCDACAQPVEVVGPLRPDGMCGMCGHGLDGHGVLTDELRRFIQPWFAACKERGIPREMIASAWDELDCEMFPLPEGVTA